MEAAVALEVVASTAKTLDFGRIAVGNLEQLRRPSWVNLESFDLSCNFVGFLKRDKLWSALKVVEMPQDGRQKLLCKKWEVAARVLM